MCVHASFDFVVLQSDSLYMCFLSLTVCLYDPVVCVKGYVLHTELACQVGAGLRGESLFVVSNACRLLITSPRTGGTLLAINLSISYSCAHSLFSVSPYSFASSVLFFCSPNCSHPTNSTFIHLYFPLRSFQLLSFFYSALSFTCLFLKISSSRVT